MHKKKRRTNCPKYASYEVSNTIIQNRVQRYCFFFIPYMTILAFLMTKSRFFLHNSKKSSNFADRNGNLTKKNGTKTILLGGNSPVC